MAGLNGANTGFEGGNIRARIAEFYEKIGLKSLIPKGIQSSADFRLSQPHYDTH
ncbi:hypothetical protein CCP3SC5AM1_1900005 [Gammaproteobacteria bacterium]